MEISPLQTPTLKRVSLGDLAPTGLARDVEQRHAKAPPVRNLHSPAKLAVDCTGAYLQVLKHRRAKHGSQLRNGSMEGGLGPLLRLVNRYGRTCVPWRLGCALTGLFKQLNLICGAKEQAKPSDDVRAYIRARGPRESKIKISAGM